MDVPADTHVFARIRRFQLVLLAGAQYTSHIFALRQVVETTAMLSQAVLGL